MSCAPQAFCILRIRSIRRVCLLDLPYHVLKKRQYMNKSSVFCLTKFAADHMFYLKYEHYVMFI